ncbi:cytochrome P450 71A1-like [Carex rostrata]
MATLFSALFLYLQDLSSLSTTHYLLILTIPILLLIYTQTRPSNPNLSLPPSPPRLPLLGHLHRIGNLPHRSLHNLSTCYGPVMYLHLGSVPTVVLSSASVIEELIHFHDIALSGRPRSAVADILLYGSSDVTFSTYGEYWRQARRICVLHLLSARRVQSFGFIRQQEVSLLIDKIRLSASNPGGYSTVVNLSQMLFKLTNDIICRATLGYKFSDDGSDKAYSLLTQFSVHLGTILVGENLPCLGWLDWLLGSKKRMRKTAEGLDNFLESAIDEHLTAKRDNLGDGENGVPMEVSDLVDVLLTIQDNDEEIGISLSRNNIKAIILDLFAAGTDTVSTALEWTMTELIKNPKQMKNVQDEVRSVIDTDGRLTEETIEKMTYLNAAIKETFRLHPPIPLLIPRESTKDIDLLGYRIPARTRFIINAWAIGRDPNTWERADEFMPERFLGSNVDYNGQHFGLIPFGTGRRTCPGISFAMTTVGFTLANLLYHFDWDLPDGMKGKPLDMSEINGIMVHRKLDLILEAKPRSI